MAEGKKSFLLYCDLIHTVKKLPKEKQAELFIHILEYVNDLNPETNDLLLNIAFEPVKQGLKRDLKKYESIVERNKNNGSLGGRPKKPKKPTGLNGNPKNPDEPKKADNDSDNDIDNVTVKDINIVDDVFLTVESCKEKYLSDNKIIKAVCGNTKNNISEIEIEERLNIFNNTLTEKGDYSKTFKDYCSHFLSWHKLNKSKSTNGIKTRGFL